MSRPNSTEAVYNAFLSENLNLARTKWKKLCGRLTESHPEKAALVARLLENEQHWLYNALDEDVKTLNVGAFDRFAFPIIRAVYPNLVATDLVSVQPMQGPTSLIFYLDARYSVTKGSAKAGATALSPISGHEPSSRYTSELVDSELLVTSPGGDDTIGGTLAWTPVRPGSVVISDGTNTITDNGAGGLSGNGLDSGTIDYATGVVALDFTAAPALGVEITASYRYVSEGNSKRPEMDIILTSQQVIADTFSLATNWSVEAEADFRAVHGIEAQTTLMSTVAEQLRYEIDRDVIADLETVAANGTLVTWDYTPPTGVDFYRHQLTFVNKLVEAGNIMFSNTRGKATGNWIVCGTNMATVVESLPGFQAVDQGEAEGVVYIGQLGRWKFYKDPWMRADYGIMGHKGSTWLKAGYAYCPYVPLWRTPIITLGDFKRRVGLMTRYAKKLLNRNYFLQLKVDNFGVL